MTRALLRQALEYALCCTHPVTDGELHRSTPCHGWDLRQLLRHVNDSLAALGAGVDGGSVGLAAAPEADGHPLGEFRARARRLRCRCSGGRPAAVVRPEATHPDAADPDAVRSGTGPGERTATVDGWPLAVDTVTLAGALEVAVHGWDIARASGLPRPVPSALAAELLRAAPRLVPARPDRHPLFGPPIPAPEGAEHGERLVAFLGRAPGVRSGPP